MSAVDPQELVGISDNDALVYIANEVNDRFEPVLSAVTEELGPAPEA